MLSVYGNRVLGKEYGRTRDGAARDWTKILNGNFYSGNPVDVSEFQYKLFNELQDKLSINELQDKLSI